MALTSKLFRGDSKLEAAAVSDPAHITPGSRGDHVKKIQSALNLLENAGLGTDGIYGQGTAAAVFSYKRKRKIINRAYQTEADNIVGKMTIASLDREVFARENVPIPPPGPPGPPIPPQPRPNLLLDFILTDPSINVTIVGKIENGISKGKKVIDPATFPGVGKLGWWDLGNVSGKFARLKVEKKGTIFWVIAFVPRGTAVSHMLHIFFHPTPVQVFPDIPGGKPVAHVIADDKDYESFGANWEDLGRRYLGDMGPQLAAARKIPMLICMMRNSAARNPNASNDIFADRPLDTMFEILRVVSEEMIDPDAENRTALPLTMDFVEIGTSSFSSGIAYHANLFNRIRTHRSYREAIDLDSSFIKSQHLDISQMKPGPLVKRHGQIGGVPSMPLSWQFPASRWDGKAANAPKGIEAIGRPPGSNEVHHLIPFRTFYGAMTNSLLKP